MYPTDSLSMLAPQNPTLKLYEKDLPDIKDIDVDDEVTLNVKVVAKSKYREDTPDQPLCITFEVQDIKVESY